MTLFSMKKFLVMVFCSLLSTTVNAGGPYTTCPYSPQMATFLGRDLVLGTYGYDFSGTTVETCPYPQFPIQTYYGEGDGNGVFFQACMAWAGSFGSANDGNEVKAKKTGCTFYKEGFYKKASEKWECCNLADCNSACVRHIVMCCVR